MLQSLADDVLNRDDDNSEVDEDNHRSRRVHKNEGRQDGEHERGVGNDAGNSIQNSAIHRTGRRVDGVVDIRLRETTQLPQRTTEKVIGKSPGRSHLNTGHVPDEGQGQNQIEEGFQQEGYRCRHHQSGDELGRGFFNANSVYAA